MVQLAIVGSGWGRVLHVHRSAVRAGHDDVAWAKDRRGDVVHVDGDFEATFTNIAKPILHLAADAPGSGGKDASRRRIALNRNDVRAVVCGINGVADRGASSGSAVHDDIIRAADLGRAVAEDGDREVAG